MRSHDQFQFVTSIDLEKDTIYFHLLKYMQYIDYFIFLLIIIKNYKITFLEISKINIAIHM